MSCICSPNRYHYQGLNVSSFRPVPHVTLAQEVTPSAENARPTSPRETEKMTPCKWVWNLPQTHIRVPLACVQRMGPGRLTQRALLQSVWLCPFSLVFCLQKCQHQCKCQWQICELEKKNDSGLGDCSISRAGTWPWMRPWVQAHCYVAVPRSTPGKLHEWWSSVLCACFSSSLYIYKIKEVKKSVCEPWNHVLAWPMCYRSKWTTTKKCVMTYTNKGQKNISHGLCIVLPRVWFWF